MRRRRNAECPLLFWCKVVFGEHFIVHLRTHRLHIDANFTPERYGEQQEIVRVTQVESQKRRHVAESRLALWTILEA